MKSIKQCMRLLPTKELPRDFNGHEAQFVKLTLLSKVVTYIVDGKKHTVNLSTWLSWPLWKYRHLKGIYTTGRSYLVTLKGESTPKLMMHFGDGVFSYLTKDDYRTMQGTDWTDFNPFTVNFAGIDKINGAKLHEKD